jgi:cytosine/adenosine deaminase-related metal-dependent hydrolase
MGATGSDWLLRGARVALGPAQSERLDLFVSKGRIANLLPPASGPLHPTGTPEPLGRVIPLEGCLLLPGLVNAHDHLEFSLFPRLGRGPFANARQWAREVYRPTESPIREQLQVPKRDRLIWGGLKNLLSGVTTVCHHNPYEPAVFDSGFPVRVVRQFGWAHSPDFSDDIPARFLATPEGRPFILHLGEATDESGRREVFGLEAMGALDGRTVLVHGVALDAEGQALVEQRGAAMVWCPSSNLFTLGTTLGGAIFARDIRLALATDSALTGDGDLLDELGVARGLDRTGSLRLYEMVTNEAAAVLRLEQGEGRLVEGGVADMVAIADPGCSPCEAIAGGFLAREAVAAETLAGHAAASETSARGNVAGQALRGAAPAEPLLVMVGGEVKLVAEEFAGRLDSRLTSRLHRIKLAGRRACLVDADVPALIASARRALGAEEPIRLAGKAIEP